MTSPADPHVAIVGGGPAGCALAIGLARAGLTVTVLDADSAPRAKLGECLSPGFAALLEQLGLRGALSGPDHLAAHGHRSFWGAERAVEESFMFRADAESWHVDRARFEARLTSEAALAGARVWRGARVLRCKRSAEAFELAIHDPQAGAHSLAADFVVDASGRSASLARGLGARRVRHDRMVAVASVIQAPPHGGISDSFTLVEATATGWWYSAALTRDRLVLTYMTDGDLLDRASLRERGRPWWRALGCPPRTIERLAHYPEVTALTSKIVVAGSARLDRIVGPGWMAIGDAAAAHDPLASYGIGAALGAGYYAAHAIRDHLADRREALDAYRFLMDRAYGAYLAQLHDTYQAEQRWPDAPFWARRRHPAYGRAAV